MKTLPNNLILISKYGFVKVETKEEKDAVIGHLNKIGVEFEVTDEWKISLKF